MNFRPSNPNRHLWDTWFYDHNGEYHLFYLSNPVSQDGTWLPWDAFSLATSTDMLTWEERGEVFEKSDNPDDWDSQIITTGDILRWDNRYYMTYRATENRVEKCNIIVSDNLYDWTRLRTDPILPPKPPYEHRPESTIHNYVEMRDVTLAELPDGGIEALFTARIDSGPHTGRGVIGRAVSQNMVDWDYTDPVFHPGIFNVIEVPSRYAHAGWDYLLFCVNRGLESAIECEEYPTMRFCTGYAASKTGCGDFEYNAEQVLGIGDAYVGRLVDVADETLFIHHICSKRPVFALPKKVVFLDDGALQLEYWKGVDALKAEASLTGFSHLRFPERNGQYVCSGSISPARCVLKNSHGFGDAFFDGIYSDFLIDVDIDLSQCISAGILLCADREKLNGVMMTLRGDRRTMQIGESKNTYNHLAPAGMRHEYVGIAGEKGSPRVVSRSEGFDWYLDGRHVFTTIDEDHLQGAVGLFVQGGSAVFSDFSLTTLVNEGGSLT